MNFPPSIAAYFAGIAQGPGDVARGFNPTGVVTSQVERGLIQGLEIAA